MKCNSIWLKKGMFVSSVMLFWHDALNCLFPLVGLLSCLLPELREEIFFVLSFSLSLCFADVWQMCVVWNNARYLKCKLGSFCASELEWFEFLLLQYLHIHLMSTYTLIQSHTHAHTYIQLHVTYTNTLIHCWQCLEEPLLVTGQCKYFPIDLLWNISYSNYAT